MVTLVKRPREEIATVVSEREDVEGALNQSEDEGDEDSLDESEDEEDNEGSLDESEDEEGEGCFHSDDEGSASKIFFRALWDHDLQFSERDYRKYSDSQREEILKYHNQMRETEGFGVTFEPKAILIGGVSPVDLTNLDSSDAKTVKECALYAINRYNEKKNDSIVFEELAKATAQACQGVMYLITFIAVSFSGEKKTYETKVWYKTGNPCSVEIFRIKKSAQV